MSDFAIEINQLHKCYSKSLIPALNGLDMTVEKGKIMGLLGPNGAGKSTTINIINGMLKPDSGSVRVLGKEVLKHKNEIRKITGVIPQEIALFSNLTAYENFNYIGQLYGLKKVELKIKVNELLDSLALKKHADKKIKQFSGGMKRRANMIASLLHQPQLLILDEPTAGVDVQSRNLILNFLKSYNQLGNTILYTSHLLEEAEDLCDTIAIVDEGKVVVKGAPQELIKNTEGCKKLEDVFIFFTGKNIRD